MTIAETFYPPPPKKKKENGKFILQILDPKNGLQVKFQTPKHGTHIPVCKYDKSPPPRESTEKAGAFVSTIYFQNCKD